MDSESLPTGMVMPKRCTQLDSDRAHRGIQLGILTGLAAGGHPIRRQADVGEAADVGRENIGDRLGHRQATRMRARSSTATGARSPIAMASPPYPS